MIDRNKVDNSKLELRKFKKGFTLVETIVIVVIVAVLALLAVQLYRGYIVESRKNTAENIAASAAGFLNSAINLGINVDNNSFPKLNGQGQWDLPMPSNNHTSILKCPAGVTITVNTGDKTVKASIKRTKSSEYKYDKK